MRGTRRPSSLLACPDARWSDIFSDMFSRLSPLVPTLVLAACASGHTDPPGGPAAAPIAAAAAAVAVAAAATAPASFVRSTAESQVTRSVDVREGLTHAQAMRLLTDALGQKYTVEITDPRAGFAMTSWSASLMRDGVPDLRYRTRITTRFLGDDWRRLQIRDEANWARGDEWDIGYDAAQLDSVMGDLRAKFARKP